MCNRESLQALTQQMGPLTQLRLRSVAALGGPCQRRIARARLLLPQIHAVGETLRDASDSDLLTLGRSLKYRVRCGTPFQELIPEAYALIREVTRRSLGMAHYDVQLLGGILLLDRCVAEMETGEGKTLTAALPLYLQALHGKGAHLATANDYLAQRDSALLRPVYNRVGLTVGVVKNADDATVRRRQYACDITYGTAREFGFDFLRDCLQQQVPMTTAAGPVAESRHSNPLVMRGTHFMLVDEADSLLIDEARTPLIIAGQGETSRTVNACVRWAALVSSQFVLETDCYCEDPRRYLELTWVGEHRLRSLPKPAALDGVSMRQLREYVERALTANRYFQRMVQYLVREGKVEIIDENTGRLAEGRRWQNGLHEAIEAKEGLEISAGTFSQARVTVQEFFRHYEHLAGMTGTAASSATELRLVYKLQVVPVPTHRPVRRVEEPLRIFATEEAKWAAVVEEVIHVHALKRPVLIGTRSIRQSSHLSELLHSAGIVHSVLNAQHPEHEAQVVKTAGQPGSVTVATNMAGRGTDIKLGPGVAELGGLHVICTELHDSPRIDRQLIGRCARQGDPGSFRKFLSLEDEIIATAYGEDRDFWFSRYQKLAPRDLDRLPHVFRRAQHRVERRQYRDRCALLYQTEHQVRIIREMGLNPYVNVPE